MAERASSARIAEWWSRWPDANVGIVTGRISSVAVLDIDPRSGGDASLRSLAERFGMPPVTPEVHTGGGGTHLWFAVDEPLSTTVLAPGIELKAEGGLVVAPPSVHASGQPYRWRPGGDPFSLELASLPGWAAHLSDGAVETESIHERPLRTAGERDEFAGAWRSAGIELLPGDRYYLCPFHDDHQPSLHIDAEGCRWYCFGCGTGGGIGRLRRMLGATGPQRPTDRLSGHLRRRLPITIHGAHEVPVVGESHHQDELLALTGGVRRYGGVNIGVVAELVPEPGNRFDPDAISVRVDGQDVGYLRREDAGWVHPLIDESLDLHGLATCEGAIRGGWDRGHSEIGLFGVTLLLPARSSCEGTLPL